MGKKWFCLLSFSCSRKRKTDVYSTGVSEERLGISVGKAATTENPNNKPMTLR